MITRSADYDLGRDKVRMKEPAEAERQHATVDELLRRLFSRDPHDGHEVQVLADEVGMGKTFVALATAYSVLTHMRERGDTHPDLAGCYEKVLVITPSNRALANKWQREVSELVRRCFHPDRQREVASWFSGHVVDRWDDLSRSLRDPSGPAVIVMTMSVLAGGKLKNYDLKRRLVLGALFRLWGPAFKKDARDRLLKGAPDDWPRRSDDVSRFYDDEQQLLPLDEDEALAALRENEEAAPMAAELLEDCRQLAEPYTRDRADGFRKIEKRLIELYTHICAVLIEKHLPLVIVDEAHNWKNGPREGSNGYRSFAGRIGPKARRALLLTATPFQLRPEEMLELLKVSDVLAPSPDPAEAQRRRERTERLRDAVIAPALKSSQRASLDFTDAWKKLPASVDPHQIEEAWQSASLLAARETLRAMANAPGAINEAELTTVVNRSVVALDPNLRDLIRRALRLYAYNFDLSRELGRLVIRHRRKTLHRAFLVGAEYPVGVESVHHRPDRHVLHGAEGIDIQGSAELPQYLLMRCVSEMKEGKGRSSLGNDLTGCYSTLLHSSEGRDLARGFRDATVGRLYLEALQSLVSEANDPEHPKLTRVVDAVIRNWRAGEKTLVFCFRTNTARRLREIIEAQIRQELQTRRETCLGGEQSLRALRGRLTGRDRDLIGLGLDRVLLSFNFGKARLLDAPLHGPELETTDNDIAEIARLALRYGVDLTGDRVDRVFLHRATEHVLARRLHTATHVDGDWKEVLETISDETWVSHPYGLDSNDDDADSSDDLTNFDERGVHSVYGRSDERLRADRVRELSNTLAERHVRGRAQGVSLLDSYAHGPSLWFGVDPRRLVEEMDERTLILRPMHRYLWDLTGEIDVHGWYSRLLVFQALRRAVLRESVLLRLLPDRTDRDETSWGELLVDHFFARLPGQTETMAGRTTAFLEDLAGTSGDVMDEGSARHAFYESTKLKDQQFVALVTGETDQDTRERIFAGFNTPLLPEILICTSVGQEGIDLHRHCRHVVHYDLAWNPAVLEQRTGRTDRIGSKTARERGHQALDAGPFLEVGVPFLAGTYDERMYEELRLRAQTFEVLTGGDLAADNPEGSDDAIESAGTPLAGLRIRPLPDRMMGELRVNLHVWRKEGRVGGEPGGESASG